MSAQRRVWSLWLVLIVLGAAEPSICEPLKAAEPAATAVDDAAAKQVIFNSPAWADMIDGLNEWLSVQITYPKEEVPQLKADFRAQVDKMSADQLQRFLADSLRKLAILRGPEALEARVWAEQRLNLFSDAKAAEFRKSMPDVLKMTALQMEQALEDLKQRRATDAASYKSFTQFRDQEVAAARARQQAEAAANAAAARNSGGGGSQPGFSGGGYSPRSFQRYPGFGVGFGGFRTGW